MTTDENRAWMRHPDLSDADPIEVVRSQIPHLAAGGWFEVDAPPPPAPPKDTAGKGMPTPTPEPKPNRTPRRRQEKSD